MIGHQSYTVLVEWTEAVKADEQFINVEVQFVGKLPWFATRKWQFDVESRHSPGPKLESRNRTHSVPSSTTVSPLRS
jgi:hypothetical protein